jgi:hypothetical protein
MGILLDTCEFSISNHESSARLERQLLLVDLWRLCCRSNKQHIATILVPVLVQYAVKQFRLLSAYVDTRSLPVNGTSTVQYSLTVLYLYRMDTVLVCTGML